MLFITSTNGEYGYMVIFLFCDKIFLIIFEPLFGRPPLKNNFINSALYNSKKAYIIQVMPLQKIQFKPGFNKQQTATGAEGQWIEGDNIRFRYGEPQKIGGWEQLVSTTLAGPAREQLTWTALNGKKYAAIGTSKLLVIYYQQQFYDITPVQLQ